MDQYEATAALFSKIKNLDPENANKVMGFILMQDFTENDLIRLALAPENQLQSLIMKAKTQLGLLSNTSSAPISPIGRPTAGHSHFPQISPRSNNLDFGKNPASPSSNSWPPFSGFPNSPRTANPIAPNSSPFLSYDNIMSNAVEDQLNEYLSFLDEPARDEGSEELGQEVNPNLHRRSFSASEVCFGSEDVGLGNRFCHYFARGFCKNGSNCKFLHGGFGDGGANFCAIVGSPNRNDGVCVEEMMRLKAAQQQRLAAHQFAASSPPLGYNKYMNFLLQQQNDPQRALMMEEEMRKFGQWRPERSDPLAMGDTDKSNSASRQIYLTFPAESTFKDEDVSEYFSNFGPVQDVRIPYQQKRMFGFVTFVYPETVKMILSRGNPHFICNSRVLVKPYKEKGKVAEKRQQHQQLERGEFAACSSPSGLDSREFFDLRLGARMYYNAHETMLRRKLEEQAELQKAIEMQGRRLMNLQLPEFKSNRISHHQRSMSVGSPAALPSQHGNSSFTLVSDDSGQKTIKDNFENPPIASFSAATAAAEQWISEVDASRICMDGNGKGKEESSNADEFGLYANVEHNLPDNLFASPTKSAGVHAAVFANVPETDKTADVSATLSSEENPMPCATSAVETASH